jgi:Xaa-Pro dipeptidase
MRARSQRIFAALREPVDAVVIANAGSHLTDATFRYVSGVTRGGYEGCAAVLQSQKRPTLIVSRLEEESARTAQESDVVAYASPAEQKEQLRARLGKPSRIGVNAAAIVLAKANLLKELFPEAALVDVGPAITAARLVKDADEIGRVRRACALTSEVAAEIPGMLRAGMTERELAGEIAGAIQRRGAQTAFDTIVCFGVTGSEPHYSPGDVKLGRGDLILVDFGSRLDDYCSDITRMYLFGRATEAQRAMFDVVRRAQAAAVDAARAGAAGRDVHLRAKEVIDASEFAGRFIHGTGHSVGLEVHDGPGFSETSELVLEPGMILTVEPGVYVPGVGGVRIEDTILVTANGAENLTPVTKELVEVSA